MMFRNHCLSRIQNCQCKEQLTRLESLGRRCEDTFMISGRYNFCASQEIGICFNNVVHSTSASQSTTITE
ncbi:hypothetical protein V1478_004191, partial [Vespula squamosa]